MQSEKSSRRDILQTIVASALLSAAPLSVLEAATKSGPPAVVRLTDGSRLRFKKVGEKQYVAVREQGSKVVDQKPTGSFTSKNGEAIALEQGKLMSMQPAPGTRRASDSFTLIGFWQ